MTTNETISNHVFTHPGQEAERLTCPCGCTLVRGDEARRLKSEGKTLLQTNTGWFYLSGPMMCTAPEAA